MRVPVSPGDWRYEARNFLASKLMQIVGRTTARAALALALVAPASVAAQQRTVQPGLSLQRIFSSSDFRLKGLPALQWTEDGQRFTYVADGDLVAEEASTGRRTVLVHGARLLLPDSLRTRPLGVPGQAGAKDEPERIEIEEYQWSPDRRKLLIYTNSQPVWRQNTKGIYYVYDVESGKLTPISRLAGWQMFAKFSPDASKVGFVRDNNLFVTDLATGRETQLTRDGSEQIINGTSDWVYEEELDLRDAWRWSPDGHRIAFWRFDQSPVPTFYMIRETDSVYTRPIPLRYPKAGEPNSRVSMHVVDLAGGQARRLDTGPLSTDVYLARMEWSPAGEVVIQRLNRHQNRLDVLLANPATGQSRTLFTEADSAWVDVDDDLTFVNSGKQFLWTSERDGFNHIYLYNRDGTVARQITRGPWDVTALLGVDTRGEHVYFAATEQGAAQRHIYRVRLDGTGFERLSREAGTHTANVSPSGSFYIDGHSRAGVPPVFSLRAADGRQVRVLEDNSRVAANLRALNLPAPEFFKTRAADGKTELNGWMIKPPNFDPSKKYPVLMYVYGGPGSQTVTDAWGGNRYLWHQHLASRGYIVASVDNRGTGGRGGGFKKATYLKLGQLETSDQVAGARYLGSLPYVDANRIGIWGWSYGGYMTLMGLTESASPFRAGISVAPVTDWRLYDNIYTERFMRAPRENTSGYDAGSPRRRAANLQGDLLLIHGTGDDNVHFQNATQMVDALQAAGKQFDFMLYPNRNHSISGGNTSLHLFTLMTNWLTEHL